MVAVFPGYETAYDGKVIDHAHNDYMEGLAETGLSWWNLRSGFSCGRSTVRGGKTSSPSKDIFSWRGLHAGAIMAVSGLLLHSLVDFNLQIPANALLFLLQVISGDGRQPLSSDAAVPRERRRFHPGHEARAIV